MQLHKGAHVVLWFRCISLCYNHFPDYFLRFGDFVLKKKIEFFIREVNLRFTNKKDTTHLVCVCPPRVNYFVIHVCIHNMYM